MQLNFNRILPWLIVGVLAAILLWPSAPVEPIVKIIERPVPVSDERPSDDSIEEFREADEEEKVEKYVQATTRRAYVEKIEAPTASVVVKSDVRGTLERLEVEVLPKKAKNTHLYMGIGANYSEKGLGPTVNAVLTHKKTAYYVFYGVVDGSVGLGVNFKLF